MSEAETAVGPAERPTAVPMLMVLALGGATVAAVVFGNGNPALAIAPVAAATATYLILKVPLRWTVSALLLLLLSLEVSTDAWGFWHTPLVVLGDLLRENLDRLLHLPGLEINGFELLLVLLLGVWVQRRANGSDIDRADNVATASVLRNALLIGMAGVAYATVNGVASGGQVAVWKIRMLLHVPAFFLLFHLAFRGPRDHVALGRIVVAAACFRAGLAIWIQHVVAPRLTGGPLAHATNHGDSILFALAIFILLVDLMERTDRERLVRAALLLPLLLLGTMANGRRLAWIMLGMMLGTAYLLSPWRPWKRALTRLVLVSIPVLAIYAGMGWGRGGAFFRPVQILRSVTDTSVDRSALWREVENWNIAMSLRARPISGIGLGQQYTTFMAGDDISGIFADYRAWPHNNILGLLLFGGLIGFAAMWAPYAVAIFLSIRSYRLAGTAVDRVAAQCCIGGILACCVLAYGDTGSHFLQHRVISALALTLAGKLAIATGAWPGGRRHAAALGAAGAPNLASAAP